MTEDQRQRLEAVWTAGVRAADPQRAVRSCLALEGGRLFVAGRFYDLDRLHRVVLVAAGKAAAPMALAVEDILGDRLAAGLAVTKDGHGLPLARTTLLEAAHPAPDERCPAAAGQLMALLQGLGSFDLVLAAISGGASALLAAPLPSLTLEHLRQATQVLLGAGADIVEINAVRKHLTQATAGRLARHASPASVEVLVVSDVLGDDLSTIASGPFHPDPTTFGQCLEILAAHGLESSLPASVMDLLRQGAAGRLPETPKLGDPSFNRVEHTIVASSATALDGAAAEALCQGCRPVVLPDPMQGEARSLAPRFAALALDCIRQGRPAFPPVCILQGGEPTVSLATGHGLGGRAQELALACALALDDILPAAMLCAGTDGTDGPTPAAGAFVSGRTAGLARRTGLDPLDYLRRNDSHTFFVLLGNHLFAPGPTRTNVLDLACLLVG